MTTNNIEWNNIEFRKVGENLYQLGDRLLRGSDPVAIHPIVDKAAREMTDDIMRTLDVSYAEYADTAHIDRARFRDWWAGQPGAQLTCHDVYEMDQLNGQFLQARVREHHEQQEQERQLRQQAQARQQEHNAERQTRSDVAQLWHQMI